MPRFYFSTTSFFVFPIFFRDVIAGGVNGDFWWGLAVSISILLGGLASPIIGGGGVNENLQSNTLAQLKYETQRDMIKNSLKTREAELLFLKKS